MMKRTGVIAVVGLVVVAGGIACEANSRQGPPAVSSWTADSTDVDVFWAVLDSTWNARDVEQFSHYFTDDASFGFVDHGMWLESRASIHSHFAEHLRRQAHDVRQATSMRRIRLIAPDVIAMDGELEVRRESAESAVPRVLQTLAIAALMVRATEGWRIHLLRAYELPPPGAPTHPH
jgi:uncharacterized protein (TIGR02246 family)